MKQLKLKNYFLVDGSEIGPDGKPVVVQSLNSWLISKLLHGKELRLRNRFVRATKERGQEIEETRKDFIDMFSEKDKDGKPKIISSPDGDRFAIKNAEEFYKQWSEYLNEDYIIELNSEMEEAAYFVRDLLNKAIENDSFYGRQSMLIEEWLNAFENIKEDKTNKE